jgi:hypothetical protein
MGFGNLVIFKILYGLSLLMLTIIALGWNKSMPTNKTMLFDRQY